MYTLQDADGGLHQELQYEALVSCRTDGRQLGERVMDSETGSVHTQLLGGDGELDGLPQRVRRPSEPATRTSNTQRTRIQPSSCAGWLGFVGPEAFRALALGRDGFSI
jgi:hypothetical protein